MSNFTSKLKVVGCALLIVGFAVTANAQEFRTISGVNNNLQHPEWGAAGTNLLRTTTNGYADGAYLPGGVNRPNPRFISNMLFSQNFLVDDHNDRSAFIWGWGQFVDHDLTFVLDHPTDAIPIVVPTNDFYFDPDGTGLAVLPLNRSVFDPSTGTGPDNPRMHPNSITHFLDGSAVYGSDPQSAGWLRTFQGGKLKVSSGNLLPYNTQSGEYADPVDPDAPHMESPVPNPKIFVAGDPRANENPFLASFHTLFVREHNRLCDELAQEHPNWTDHQLYQQARKLVGAYMQAITYEEWLPALGIYLDPYQGYDPGMNPGITNEFSAAAFRVGHTMLTGIMPRLDENMNTIPEGDLMLRHAFFNVNAVSSVGIEPYLRGMSELKQQNVDCKVIDDVRHFLFGPPGSGGRDLVAINIQRGRERGLADYNTTRVDLGLDPISSFYDITADPLMSLSLEDTYGNVNDIDLWIGLLAEDHMEGAIFGPTIMELLKRQFTALRDGDRFYFENDPWLSPEEKAEIRNIRLSDIVRRNTDFQDAQEAIFFVPSTPTATKERIQYPVLDLTVAPVPTTGPCTATITAPQNTPVTLQLVDMRGSVRWERQMDLLQGENVVDLNLDQRFGPGEYYFLVKTGYRTANYKIILKLR